MYPGVAGSNHDNREWGIGHGGLGIGETGRRKGVSTPVATTEEIPKGALSIEN